MDILTNIWLSENIIIWYADWQIAFDQIDWLGTGHYLSPGHLEDFSCVTLKFTWFFPPPLIRLCSILNISPPLLSPHPTPPPPHHWWSIGSQLSSLPLYTVLAITGNRKTIGKHIGKPHLSIGNIVCKHAHKQVCVCCHHDMVLDMWVWYAKIVVAHFSMLVAFVITKSCYLWLWKASSVLGSFLPVPPQIKWFVNKLWCLHTVERTLNVMLSLLVKSFYGYVVLCHSLVIRNAAVTI